MENRSRIFAWAVCVKIGDFLLSSLCIGFERCVDTCFRIQCTSSMVSFIALLTKKQNLGWYSYIRWIPYNISCWTSFWYPYIKHPFEIWHLWSDHLLQWYGNKLSKETQLRRPEHTSNRLLWHSFLYITFYYKLSKYWVTNWMFTYCDSCYNNS